MRTIYNLLQKQRGKKELMATGSSVQTPDSQFRPFQVYIGVLRLETTHESGRPANSSLHYNSACAIVRSWPPFANDKDSLEDTKTTHMEYLQKLCRAQALHCEITEAIRIPLDNAYSEIICAA